MGLTFEEGAAHYVAEGRPVRLAYMKEGVISKPDVVCIVKGTPHMEAAEAFVDFVTGRDAQTIISAQLDRRSVRTDVEEPDYLPDKAQLTIIHDDREVVGGSKKQWLEHFDRLFQEALGKDGTG